VKQVRF